MATSAKRKKSLIFIVVTQTLGIIVSSALVTWILTWTGRPFPEVLPIGVLLAIGSYAVNWFAQRKFAKESLIK